ncbi:MAG TPA: 5'-deoxyadenosine deaminase [Vicinamibacterales bacterium]|nr:5'-deoxyadenosine deaminase [Vicinamibacterales bacterium]
MSTLLVRNATILTMNDAFDIVDGDVSVRDGVITAVGGDADDGRHDTEIDARGGFLLPGLIQTHVHLCQTLFRGYADDLPLLDWLRRRVWPMEAAHTPASLAVSARLAASELLLSGTTTVLTMETVHDTEAVLEALGDTGLRAVVGKCMMDVDSPEVPRRLRESTRDSLQESQGLVARWSARPGLVRAAFAPRFALSCTRDLLEAVAALSASTGALIHTHASESPDEMEAVRRLTGMDNLDYLAQIGLATPRLCAAHCVWAGDAQQGLLARQDVKVLHCPSSNLKLGSGVAPVVELLARGVSVSLGADGAACNNRLDMFEEMRLAAVLQAMRRGPGALPARDALRMATREGARALGLSTELGSIEPGKRADLIVIDRDRPHLATAPDPCSAIVYSATGADVRATIVNGEAVVRDFALVRLDRDAVVAEAREAAGALARRAGVV